MSGRPTNLFEPAPPAPALISASPPDPVTAPEVGPLALSPSELPPKLKPRAVMLTMPGRCVEKGCVFPAMPVAGGRCVHHQRQQQEPGLYSSRQPSSAVVAQGKFGPPRVEEIEREERGTRVEDRRRMFKERERFLAE